MTDTKNTVSDELATRLETALRAMPDINHGPLDKGMYRRALTDLAVAIGVACRALRASIPGGVGVKLEALAYDWEYIDPKTGHWSYARTPERANHLQAQGVKLTPVYTLEVVRQAQSALDLSPAEGEPVGIVVPEDDDLRVYWYEGSAISEGDEIYAAPSNPVISDGWQPIETAPKNGTKFLGWASKGCSIMYWVEAYGGSPDDPGMDAGWLALDGETCPSSKDYGTPAQGVPSHWRPLPAAPAALSVKPQSGSDKP